MSLIGSLKGTFKKSANGFGPTTTAEQVTEGRSLAGKVFVVTGCTSGIGTETARVLALRGAHVIGLGRTLPKTQETLASLGGKVGGKTTAVACELSDPASVRSAIEEIKKLGVGLDGILCNAGIMALPRFEECHGFEKQFYTNHLGHFQLVNGLLGSLQKNGRIVLVSSSAHFAAPRGGIDFDHLRSSAGYSSWRAYGRSKFANLVFAKELARRGYTAYAVHPGVIVTGLGRYMSRWMNTVSRWIEPIFMKSIPQGAATTVYVATCEGLPGPSGSYFMDCNIGKFRKDADDAETGRRLWEVSEQAFAKI